MSWRGGGASLSAVWEMTISDSRSALERDDEVVEDVGDLLHFGLGGRIGDGEVGHSEAVDVPGGLRGDLVVDGGVNVHEGVAEVFSGEGAGIGDGVVEGSELAAQFGGADG